MSFPVSIKVYLIFRGQGIHKRQIVFLVNSLLMIFFKENMFVSNVIFTDFQIKHPVLVFGGAITNYHNPNGLTQIYGLWLCGYEVLYMLFGTKIKVPEALLSEVIEVNMFSCLLQILEVACIPWLWPLLLSLKQQPIESI